MILRHLLWVAISTLSLLSLQAQDTVLLETYWENGKQKEEGLLVSGERDGVWVEFYSDGTLALHFEYNMGVNTGAWKYYCNHGYLRRTIKWENNICKSLIINYFDGEPHIFLSFKDGISERILLEYLEICDFNENAQYTLFENYSIKGKYLHFFALGDYYISDGMVFLNQEQKLSYNISGEMIDMHYRIDELKYSQIKAITLGINQEVNFLFHPRVDDFSYFLQIDDIGNSFEDSVSHYAVSPYGRFEQWTTLNDKLVNKVEYKSNRETYQNCSYYFQMEI